MLKEDFVTEVDQSGVDRELPGNGTFRSELHRSPDTHPVPVIRVRNCITWRMAPQIRILLSVLSV